MLPRLAAPPPPVNPTTLSTAGSELVISANCTSIFCIVWEDVSWSAWIDPLKRPVSCCGKKPLGTTMYRYTVSPTVISSTMDVRYG